MKLRTVDTRKPKQVRVAFDAVLHDKLLAYVEYAKSQGQHYDVHSLVIEICRAFVERGDKNFLGWLRTQSLKMGNGKAPQAEVDLSEVMEAAGLPALPKEGKP